MPIARMWKFFKWQIEGGVLMSKYQIKTEGNAVCYKCGVELIAPADGQPYWCIKCSNDDALDNRGQSPPPAWKDEWDDEEP